MFNTVDGYSLSDIAAVTDRNNDGFGANNGAWWIIILFLFMFMGWGRNGFGANDAATQGALTRSDLFEGFNNQDVNGQLRGITQGLCDGFYSQNSTILQGLNGVQRDLCTGFSAVAQGFDGVNSNIAESRYAAQQCCCETNRNIDSVRAENYKNTCDITNAIHAEGEATRALINANTMQELRDRLTAKDSALMTANFQLSQQAQNAYLVNELRPCPIPAYLTCSPYAAYPFNNYGNCGCGTCA